MNNDEDHLPELIDSCRQADDLQLPELQALSAAIQADPQVDRRLKKSHRIDAVIGQSIRDVAIPAGLEERLFAALASSQPSTEAIGSVPEIDTDHEVPANEVPTNEVPTVDHGVADVDVVPIASRRAARNHWKVWLSTVAAVAAVAWIAFLVFPESDPHFASPEDVANQSQKWLAALGNQWARDGFPVQKFPLPKQPRLPDLYRWQRVASTSSALEVICYEISPPQSGTYLFVCRGSRSPALPETPPDVPDPLKSGWLVGGWQSGDVVYVLAVRGNEKQYRALIHPNLNIASTARARARS